MFRKVEIVPRWIIFTIDIVLSVFALLLAKISEQNFIIGNVNLQALYQAVVTVTLVNVILFAVVKAYAGIVRYTSGQDSVRILFTVLLSSFLIFFVNAVIIAFGGEHLITYLVLIIYSLFTFLFLITYRILVKYFFMYIKNSKLDEIRIIIYGAGEAGLITKRGLDHGTKVNKRIIAFVDDDIRKIGKTIEGVKILNASSLRSLIAKYEVHELIFASYTIPLNRKNKVVDICLENSVKVLNIPPPEVWASGDINVSQIHDINIEDLLDRKTIQIDTDGIQNELKDKRILITGAAGSIGSEIVRQLMKFEVGLVIMCDQNETALHDLFLEIEEKREHSGFHAFVGDVRDLKRMEFLFDFFQPHYVYHAAAYKHVPIMENNPAEAIKTNVLGTKNIADLSIRYNVRKFVMISTDKAVNPTNVMGASKRIAEIYIQSLNALNNGKSALKHTKFITTRFGNVLGSNGSVIPRFKKQIEKGGPVTVTHPEITRYFMTIPEACRLVLEAAYMGNGGEIFVFDMGVSVKISDLAKRMIGLAGMVPNQDIHITYTGLRAGEKLFEELLNDNENTLPTHHKKILIGKVREYEFSEVEYQINILLDQARINDVRGLVLQMKKIVPEFKSMNSVFEKLDILPA